MNKQRKPKASGAARPITTKRDYAAAAAVVKNLSGQAGPDSTAELRVQALLKEMDRFDDSDEDASTDIAEAYDYTGPRRRWSDD